VLLLLFGAGCMRAGAPDFPAPIAEGVQPNVLWIVLDACRAENLSCNGYERDTTPNIDALAARGVTFTKAYAQSNNTLRSVPSYMTGRYFPVSCLTPRGNVPYVRRRPPEEVMFPDAMRANGYRTAMISAHAGFVQPPSDFWDAFDSSISAVKGDTPGPLLTFDDVNAHALPWLELNAGSPFFLYLHTVDTHFPHVLEPPFDRWIDPEYDTTQLTGGLTDRTMKRKDGQPFGPADEAYLRALYDGSLAYADHYVGQVVAKLEELGILDETIIVIMSDHGEALFEDGKTFEHSNAGASDQVLRVPLVFAGPGIPARGALDTLVGNVDIVPTFIAALGLNTEARPDGRSLLPVMQSRRPRHHEGVLAWHVGHRPAGETYDDFPALVWVTDTAKFESDPTIGAKFLWAMPDDLRARRDLLESGRRADLQKADFLERRMNAVAVPRRDAYFQLPVDEVLLEGAYLGGFVSDSPIYAWHGSEEEAEFHTDGRWTVTNAFVWSAGFGEDAPPIDIALPIPNGTYTVEVRLRHASELLGHPASSVAVRLGAEGESSVFSTTDYASDARGLVSVGVGNITVEDGMFRARLDDVPGESAWTFIRSVRIYDPSAAPRLRDEGEDDLDTLQFIEDKLRTMGYIR
jgi:arylsulfatase A-like enzyme